MTRFLVLLCALFAVLLSSADADELRFDYLRTYTGWPDCFPALARGNLREETYTWKRTEQGNLRAYVLYPPGYMPGGRQSQQPRSSTAAAGV